ncbi:hypothetical protein [Catenovulum sediminis]|uniref:MarR family transcriptional regulator n=1 Tax=Catenovulum sediminis TaxID=1740262 RepID=A0ABV1RI52_9ALTE
MMDFEISEKQQCVIDALFNSNSEDVQRKTVDEIARDCHFVSIAQAASILGTLKRKGVTVKSANKWRLTGHFIEYLNKNRECENTKKRGPQNASLDLKIETLQALSKFLSDDIADVLNSIVNDLKGAV